ncbi:MAG: CoA pyrophosphatase [Saprospiraceae bacterium]|jgi:8-oxo-dGTP pyrophosphatase MutT (NUDIX family)|nr:CoA pyrophosphatase [Saprospiraceae bacterium]MDP4819896.1 CoA pyrophosphatase [Saprospiraceae bacterium]MDP5000182.1 CoA pyrophosphatase [Saprospiraceae bacterium]
MYPIITGQLQQKLAQPLPGMPAQFKMAHVGRSLIPKVPEHAKLASVLVLFYPKADHWHLVFIERNTSNTNDRHRGQIGFPGGKYEETDPDLMHTALREAHEEVGVSIEQVHILGSLTSLYIPVSNFLVHPFVGITDTCPCFAAQESEVKNIIEIPYHWFFIPELTVVDKLQLSDQLTLHQVPQFTIDGKIIWGATAMILSELKEIIRPEDFSTPNIR